MAEVKWIKIVTDIFNNKKIKQIDAMPEADSILVIWFKILCLAGSINDCGNLMFSKNMPYTDEMLATEFRKPINTIRLALTTFKSFGMIEIIESTYRITNWERYQNIEGLEKIREQTKLRVAKHRENKKLLHCNVTSNATVTQCNTDVTHLERELELEKDLKDSPRVNALHTHTHDDKTGIGVEDENIDDTPFIEITRTTDASGTGVEDYIIDDGSRAASRATTATAEVGAEVLRKNTAKKIKDVKIGEYFETTWKMYPKRVNKIAALKTYGYKLRGLDEEAAAKVANKIYSMLTKQLKVWAAEGEHGRDIEYIPHFATWLNANIADADGKLRCR